MCKKHFAPALKGIREMIDEIHARKRPMWDDDKGYLAGLMRAEKIVEEAQNNAPAHRRRKTKAAVRSGNRGRQTDASLHA